MTIPDPMYRIENVSLFETIYGKNLISLGDLDAVDNMFSDLNLRGLKLLDIGFGLGGVAFYLANTYQIEVAGVEVHSWMVKYAETHAPKNITPQLKFAVYDQAGEIPFKAASFDLVYSKGVLNHVRNKDKLFRQINKMLKPDGLFVIADWIYPEAISDDSSPLVNETQQSYQGILEKTEFKDISFRDDSIVFLGYVKKLLENLISSREYIEKEYGTEIFSTIWHNHQKLIEDINSKLKFAIRIIAKKAME
jgi:ubiquinone/menaquinone biosynthesis C-methylase UbiE